MTAPCVELSNGQKMPCIALGTWQATPNAVGDAVKLAIDIGYRHFDCAMLYQNEGEIGKAIKEKINAGAVKREDLFIVSKLWNTYHDHDLVVPTCEKSLESFGLGYLDLYLIHWPVALEPAGFNSAFPFSNPVGKDYDYVETWKGMEECYELGLTKGIGLSNFNIDQMQRVIDHGRVKPIVNQVEAHPLLNQKHLRTFCKQHHIAVTGYAPLGSPEKYTPNIHLGPKETDAFIKNTHTLSALKTSKKLWKILNTKQIGKSMGSDFKDFYFARFPKRINEVKDNLDDNYKLLSFLPNGPARLKMFSTTFQQIYGNELWEYPDLMRKKLIEWMSPDDRTTWMECHSKPSAISEETWISYYKTERSIPLLKEKLLLTSNINVRKNYVCALLKTCKLNRDESALLDVLKYINLKHRNDNNLILQEVITTFNKCYNENQLTETHWNEIYQCVQYFVLNKGYNYFTRNILEKCIHYRLSHSLSIDGILEFWVRQYPHEYNICRSKPKFEKQCLINMEALIPCGYRFKNIKQSYLRYLYDVNSYNVKHKRDKILINIKDEYIQYIKISLEDDDYNFEGESAAYALIMQDCDVAVEHGILELFFKQNSNHMYQVRVMEWLIKDNPLLLLNYLQNILKVRWSNCDYELFRKFCKKYTHLQIPQKLSKLCYDYINGGGTNLYRIVSSIIILSMVAAPQEFLTYFSSYYPTELSLDLENNTNQIYYIKLQAIVGHLKNLIPPSDTLDGILHFCKGDYLKLVQQTLDIVSNNVIENRLHVFFNTLSKRAVSVRKHAIFLSCKVSNKIHVNNMLLELAKTEKNASLRKLLFKTVFRAFLRDPNDSSWGLTKQLLDTIDCSDREAFEILTSCRHVPLEYFDQYLEYSWNILGKCTSSKKTIEDGQLRLLNLTSTANISTIPSKLSSTIIEQNLFKCNQLTDLQRAFQSFTCKYLIYGPGKEEDRLETVFSLLKNFKSANWNDIKMIPLSFKLISNFVKQFCEDIIDKKCSNKGIFEQFFSKWQKLIKPSEMFDEFVYLQLTSVYLSALNKKLNIGEVGKNIAFICNLLHKENCLGVLHFSNILKPFLSHFYSLECIGESDENDIILIESVVDSGNSYSCLELVVYLLPFDIPITPIVKQKYDYIIDILSKETDPKFQVIFNAYLRDIIIPTV